MSRVIEYRQCVLTKDLGQGVVSTQTTWLPSKYASVGKSLCLKESVGWDDGWIVDSVGGVSTDAPERARDFKRQRSVSDRKRDPRRKKLNTEGI